MINELSIVLMVMLMTLLGSFGSLFFKLSANEHRGMKGIINKKILMGGLLYFLSALVNIVLLKYLPLSIVLPATSLTYVWTVIVARVYLAEKITLMRVIGLVMIISGVIGIGISV